ERHRHRRARGDPRPGRRGRDRGAGRAARGLRPHRHAQPRGRLLHALPLSPVGQREGRRPGHRRPGDRHRGRGADARGAPHRVPGPRSRGRRQTRAHGPAGMAAKQARPLNGLPALRGHEAARRLLAEAALRGELPGSLLLHGPAGIGKQRLGLWLGQLLLCEAPTGEEPCGACQHCRFAVRLEHPDLQWFFPLPRPKGASGPDKLATALEEARADELAERARTGLWITTPDEPVGLSLAQIRTLARMAVTRPALGRRKVFLIGQAEHLVAQDASPEAANALLKLLEEPPPDVTLVLTAADPEDLLPTIRSRLLPIALRPLPDAEVAAFLTEVTGTPPREAARIATLAQGSIGRALGFLPQDGAEGPLEAIRQRARALLEAAV